MTQLNDLASRLLRFEQQLAAYQKLHADEMAELWRVLDECKRVLVTALPPQKEQTYLTTPLHGSQKIRSEE